ncbi:MAG: NUDIX hydrolase [Gammaproteobacteria bacterium]|nr:NUDIX hydrolase [Gammaproteobacteria bacterium]
MKFCSRCGHSVEHRIPEGDHQPRAVCPVCSAVHYINPKMVVGCIPETPDGRILMCKRDILPRIGKWTVPAGYLEMGETTAEGAARETIEESQALVTMGRLVAVMDIPRVDQVYLIYHGTLAADAHFGPTPESSEVCLMREEDIPWSEIAFRTIEIALRAFFEDRRLGISRVHHEVVRLPAR